MPFGERVANLLIRKRGTFLLAVLLLTVFFAWRATFLTFSTAPETILESGYRDLEHLRDHEKHFGGFERTVVLVFEEADVFSEEARRRIRKATDALRGLSIVTRVRTLYDSGFPLPDPVGEPEAFRREALANPLVSPFLVSADGSFGGIEVSLGPDADSSARREESLARVEEAAAGAGLDALTGGVPAVRRAYAAHIRKDVFQLPPIISGLLFLVLLVIFRRVALALAPLIVVGVATIWTVGFLSLTGGRVTALTSILPSLTLVVGVATGIHVVSGFAEEREKGAEPKRAAATAMMRMLLPCSLTALTTAVGFCSLTVARIRDVREFGLYCAVGALLSFSIGVPLVGVLLSYLRGRARAEPVGASPLDRPLRRLGLFLVRRPRAAVLAGVLVGVVSMAGVFRLESETFILEDVREADPVRRAGAAIDRHLGGMLSFDLVLDAPGRLLSPDTVRWMMDLEARLRGLLHVSAVVGPGTLLDRSARSVGLPAMAVSGAPGLLARISERGGADAVAGLVSADRSLGRINVRYRDVGSRRSAELREEALAMALADAPPGVEVRVAGLAVLADVLLGRLMTEMAKSTALAFVGIFVLMTLLLRSVAFGALSMVPNFLPLLAAGGFMGVAGITIRSSIALIFAVALGIAVDDTIHMLTRFRRERRAGGNRRRAVRRSVRWTGRPVFLTSAVLFFGFLTFLISDFKATEQFGLISAVTIAAALVGDLILLPGLLLLKGGRR